MIREAARDFARTELLPGVIERDEKQEFPNELVKKMGDLGFMGIMVDPKYGGSGMDTISYVLIMTPVLRVKGRFQLSYCCLTAEVWITMLRNSGRDI